MLGVERQSSIENEPRTLNNDQIDFAREAALYVVNTSSSIQEALTIFTQGLEPVVRSDEDGGDSESVGVGNMEDHHNIRDTVSAPF
ncbi:hypothetical protein SASPL_131208 [Salvia splendens]|uniref:Uncharacterized protein n=1 Tax=Salvia splendens TaxID=180675 RepID=A0A8X8X8U2_SALSN|nr:uncharacterized protein LOC121755020 [Salvia splendens]KAG6408204.1 hypothetical protein SASPL_131208 [Salvia splendens]